MIYLEGEERDLALKFFDQAAQVAKDATCTRSKCGSVIATNSKLDQNLSSLILGKGYNSPPGNLNEQKRCSNKKDDYHKKITDKTCCIHAEQRAIVDALQKDSTRLKDSSLYFIRLDDNDNPKKSGEPYCTICSKMALDVGIKEFVLWHKEGICAYKTDEYNDLSYEFGLKKI